MKFCVRGALIGMTACGLVFAGCSNSSEEAATPAKDGAPAPSQGGAPAPTTTPAGAPAAAPGTASQAGNLPDGNAQHQHKGPSKK